MVSLNLSRKILLGLSTSIVGTGIIAGSILSKKENTPSRKNLQNNTSEEDNLTNRKEQRTQKIDEISDPLPNSPENKIDVLISKNQEKEIITKSIVEENIIHNPNKEDIVANLNKSELSVLQIKAKYDSEIEEKNISLESVWMSKQGSYCFLLKNNQQEDIPNIIEQHDESPTTCDDESFKFETTWSDHKKLEDNDQEGLWIRGNKDKVREMFKKNFEDLLKPSNLIKKDETMESISSNKFKDMMNDSICILNEKDNVNWIEISCLIPRLR